LYPKEIPTSFLRAIYVRDTDDAALAESFSVGCDHPLVPILVKPEAFQ